MPFPPLLSMLCHFVSLLNFPELKNSLLPLLIRQVVVGFDGVWIRAYNGQNVSAFQLPVRVVRRCHVSIRHHVEVVDDDVEGGAIAGSDEKLLQLFVGPDAKGPLWTF